MAYKQCSLTERAFCRSKDWRARATRSHSAERNFLAAIAIVVAIIQ